MATNTESPAFTFALRWLPADDLEIIEDDEEGIVRHHSLGPKEILPDDGHVNGVVFQRCTRVFDEHGRFVPQFDDSDLTTIEADTVVWSIGQQQITSRSSVT